MSPSPRSQQQQFILDLLSTPFLSDMRQQTPARAAENIRAGSSLRRFHRRERPLSKKPTTPSAALIAVQPRTRFLLFIAVLATARTHACAVEVPFLLPG